MTGKIFPLAAPVSAGVKGKVGVGENAAGKGRRARASLLRVPRLALFWTLVALGVRFVAALFFHFYSLSIGQGGYYPLGISDDRAYFLFSDNIYNGRPAPWTGNFYPFVLAGFYHLVGGPSLLMGQLLSAVMGALTVGIAVLLVRELTRGRPKAERTRIVHWTGMLLTFYPSLLWYSTQLLKDPILILLGMGALYCQVLFLKRARLVTVLVWLGCLGGMTLFRPYAPAALVLALALFFTRFNRKWLVPMIAFMALAPYALGWGFFGFNIVAPLAATENLSTFRQQGYSSGGSSAGITISYSNPIAFATTFSYSFATAMFGPFPWQIRAAAQAVALPEAIGIWFLFSLWLRGVRDLFRRKVKGDKNSSRDLVLLGFSLILTGIVAIFSDNIGANTRLRLLPWSAFLIFAAIRLGRKHWKLFGSAE